MFVHKVDEELALKLVETSDAERIFELTDRSRDMLREWLPWLDHTQTVGDTKRFIESGASNFVLGKSLNCAIVYQGELAGIAGFNEISEAKQTAYIGYWLDREYQGKGIMTRVASALTDYALMERGLNKVEIRAAVGNEKSRNVPVRLGYTEEGTIRQGEWLYDHFVDSVVYGMLKSEWTSLNEK
ncbi:GNAT family protein [Planococcus sp. ISL-109]|uniref:GNAT family N-acetyltransferase n=1 Tax=Planococcus sp. ISL-109 TaxID=2819166 RepID=UPI001BE8A38C|nr:GNAT family protein [Planococcus sp. ISL-109]MBT2583889.1 GNAT family N-acetyltransferase [Planococcus sp. ISL-109]